MKLTNHPITGLIALGLALLLTTGSAMAAVLNSVHDLSAGSGGTEVADNNDATADDTQVCAFCHTPHDSATTAAQVIPLWNRTTTATTYTSAGNTTYTDNGGGTLSGTVLDLTTGVSMACLSCHDGTIAMDQLLNIPGSGDSWATTAMTGANIDAGAGDGLGTSGKGVVTGVINLGTDLSNDHPVAINYGGGGCDTADAGCLATALTDTAMNGTVKNGNQHWVDASGTGAGVFDPVNDVIPLFTRDFGGTDQPSIECASCHDVHNGTAAAANGMLLRVSATDSAICTACHVK